MLTPFKSFLGILLLDPPFKFSLLDPRFKFKLLLDPAAAATTQRPGPAATVNTVPGVPDIQV